MSPRLFCALATAGTVALAHPAVADDAFVLESFQVPTDCGDRAAFAAALSEAVMGYEEEGQVARISLVAEGTDRQTTITLRILQRGEEGVRVFEGAPCRDLLADALVVASLALAPPLLFETNERVAPNVQMTDLESPEFRRVAEDDATSFAQDAQPDTLGLRIDIFGLAELGTLPAAALGTGIGMSAQPSRLLFRIHLARWAEQARDAFVDEDRTQTLEARLDHLSGGITACWFGDDWKGLGACAQLVVGRLAVSLPEISNPLEQTNIQVAPGAGLLWDAVRVGRTSLRLEGMVLAHLIRQRFTVDVVGFDPDLDPPDRVIKQDFHTVGPLSWQLAAGVGVDF